MLDELISISEPSMPEVEDCGLFVPANLPVPYNDTMRLIDSSKLNQYQSCPRSYFFRYLLGLVPSGGNLHLAFGSAWHSALEVLYKEGIRKNKIPLAFSAFMETFEKMGGTTLPEHPNKNPNMALQALVSYVGTYANDLDGLTLIATETGGLLEIPAMDSFGKDHSITYRFDGLFRRHDGKVVVLEHKTASRGGRTWADSWDHALQIGTYITAANQNYCMEGVEALVYVNGTVFLKGKQDFIRVPQMRSKKQLNLWYYQICDLINRIEADTIALASYVDLPVMACFLPNTCSCTSFGGCPYDLLCQTKMNPINLTDADTADFDVSWWNPLGE